MNIPAVGTEPLPIPVRRALTVLLWYFGAQVVFGLFLFIGLALWASLSGPHIEVRFDQLLTRSLVPGTVGGLAFSAWVLWRKAIATLPGAVPTALATLGVRPSRPRVVWLAAGCGIGLALFYLLVLTQLFPPKPGQQFGPLSSAVSNSRWDRVILAIGAVLLAPPAEEFLFRGYLFTALARAFGPVFAGVVITAVFSLGHLTEVRTYWPALAGITGMAVVTLVLRLTSRSLLPSVTLHASYNATLMVVMFTGAT